VEKGQGVPKKTKNQNTTRRVREEREEDHGEEMGSEQMGSIAVGVVEHGETAGKA